jgi:hypothetical protein
MRQQRIACNYDICAWNYRSQQKRRETTKKAVESFQIIAVENCKPRKRCTFVSIERWRYSPHSSAAISQFGLLLFGVLHQSIGRVGDNSVDGRWFARRKPFKAVSTQELRFSDCHRRLVQHIIAS